ncbi:MAG: CBS domain-containing protein [Oscillospiraceae bacterium]|nr:CBS domain-containing protein [Oscillospiraceae bacterium]
MNTAMLIKPKSEVSYLYSDMTAAEGLDKFIETGFTAIPVIDREGLYIGVVSERDFLYKILDTGSVSAIGSDGMTLGDLASVSRFETVYIDADYATLFDKIISQNFIPVIDSRGIFSGIVTRHDVLIAMEPSSRNIT